MLQLDKKIDHGDHNNQNRSNHSKNSARVGTALPNTSGQTTASRTRRVRTVQRSTWAQAAGSPTCHLLPVEDGVKGVGCAAAVDFILGVVHCQELRLVAVVSCVQRRRDKNARLVIQRNVQQHTSCGVAATAQHPSGRCAWPVEPRTPCA